ncbi:MAG: hypothetical protein ACM3ZA_15375 [Bacillota bacterium]
MQTHFRLSARRPIFWAALWSLIILAAMVRLGPRSVPVLLGSGVLLLLTAIWANAGPGIVMSLEDRDGSLVLRQVLSGREEVPWHDVVEASVLQRQDKFMLYPLLRLKTQSGRNVFLPLYLVDNPQGLKRLVCDRAGLERAPLVDPMQTERWVRSVED